MDKSWVKLNRKSPAYEAGLQRFLDLAFELVDFDGRIKCPCKKCGNVRYHNRETVYEHMLARGMDVGYAHHIWTFHNEHHLLAKMAASEPESRESDEVQSKYTKMQQPLAACPEHTPKSLNANEAFIQVMGADSHVTPAQQRGALGSISEVAELTARAIKAEREVVELREQYLRDIEELREAHRYEMEMTRAQLNVLMEQQRAFHKLFASFHDRFHDRVMASTLSPMTALPPYTDETHPPSDSQPR